MPEITTQAQARRTNPSSRAWLWLLLARAALTGQDLVWIAAWYRFLINPAADLWVVSLTLLVIVGGSQFLTHALNTRAISKKRRNILFVVWLLLITIISLHVLVYPNSRASSLAILGTLLQEIAGGEYSGFWHILLIQLAALRAVLQAHKPVDTTALTESMSLGLLLLLALGLFLPPWALPYLISLLTLLLFFSLVGTSLARIASLGESGHARLPLLGARWGAGILLAAWLVIGIALGLGLLFNEQVTLWVSQVLLALISLAISAVGLLAAPILFVLLLGFELLRQLGQDAVVQETPAPATLEILEQIKDLGAENTNFLQNLWNNSRAFLMAALVIFIVVMILRRLEWQPWRRRPVLDEDGGSALPSVPGLLPKLAKRQAWLTGSGLRSGRQYLAAFQIRRVYAELLGLCARIGKPRPPAKTPLEFLPDLARVFPNETTELEIITFAYVKVRYGLLPETQAEVEDVLKAWGKIKTSAKGLIPKRQRGSQ